MTADQELRFGTASYVRLATEHARIVAELHNELERAFTAIDGMKARIAELEAEKKNDNQAK